MIRTDMANMAEKVTAGDNGELVIRRVTEDAKDGLRCNEDDVCFVFTFCSSRLEPYLWSQAKRMSSQVQATDA